MKIRTIVSLFVLSVIANGCFLISNINQEEFDKSREAKTLEARAKSAERQKLSMDKNTGSAYDFSIDLSYDFIKKFVKLYEGSKGWMDANTSYTVEKIDLSLENAAAIATLNIKAFNNQYGVDVFLKMDCMLTFEIQKNELYFKLEPFNISPDVKASGALSIMDKVIAELIKVNVGSMSEKFPPMKMPVDFKNQVKIPAVNMPIKDKINMLITSPERNMVYTLKIIDVYVFKNKASALLKLDDISVK